MGERKAEALRKIRKQKVKARRERERREKQFPVAEVIERRGHQVAISSQREEASSSSSSSSELLNF